MAPLLKDLREDDGKSRFWTRHGTTDLVWEPDGFEVQARMKCALSNRWRRANSAGVDKNSAGGCRRGRQRCPRDLARIYFSSDG
jgi:hypothetical protein